MARRQLPPSYQQQKEHNERMISELLQKVRPDVWVLMDLLDKTNINYVIIFKFIRQINNVMMGTKSGLISLAIAQGVAKYIRGEETDKIEERVLIESKKIISP